MIRTAFLSVRVIVALAALAACKSPQVEPEPAPVASVASVASPVASPVAAGKQLGAAIDPKAPVVALADLAKNPGAYAGKAFTTTGTVTEVCAHKGCWMELKDDASQAHVKMAGHSFFVPRNASGKKARIAASLEKDTTASCTDEAEHAGSGSEKQGCRAEAEDQLGHPLAKLELVAAGVELL